MTDTLESATVPICPDCHGTGKIDLETPSAPGNIDCPACRGTGVAGGAVCPASPIDVERNMLRQRIEELEGKLAETKVKRQKVSYVGAPAIFALQSACQDLARAFNSYGVYLVGSALDRPDWRDVDVRMIMKDSAFTALFPHAGIHWEVDPRWLWMTISISERLSKLTGLPIDFQFQPQTHANKHHKGRRDCLSIYFRGETEDE